MPYSKMTTLLESLTLLLRPLLVIVLVASLFWFGGRSVSSLRILWLRYRFLLHGSEMLNNAHKHANGEPYLILEPQRTTTMITSHQHVKELEKAPRNMLSLHAVAKDFIQPYYTMNGFAWKDQRGVEGTAYVVALHNMLTDRLHELVPKVHTILLNTFEAEVAKLSVKTSDSDWSLLPIYETAKRLVTNANCAIFFPKELAENEEFQKAAFAWPTDVAIAAEMIQLLPQGIGPFIGKLLTRNHRSSKIMYDYIFPMIKQRFTEQETGGGFHNFEPDIVTQVLSTMPKKASWSPERLAGEVMAVWFGSLHSLSLPTTNAMIDICEHPEYINGLREEAEGPEWEGFFRTGHGLPQADSFLMESTRLNLFEGAPIRRKALQEFVFSDGLKICKDDCVSIPVRPMWSDEKNFAEPQTFDGRRFLKQITDDATKKASGLSHTSDRWMLWGTGTRLLCPGRYYASAIMKLIISIMVTRYDFTLEPRKGSHYMQWRTAHIVRSSLRLRIKPKGIVA